MKLPVHVLEQPAEGAQLQLPEDNLCYFVGSNGVFKHVSNDFYTVNVKTEKIKHLAEVKEHARIHLPKLPFNLLKRIESFFRAAYDKYQSEAVVMLYAHPEKEENAWRLEVPKQEVSGGHVKYDLTNVPTEIDGYRLFGTVHSHANMGAFHSGTDDNDEKQFDGLHITIGNINTSMSYSARWIFCSTVFECKLSEWVSNPPEGEADPSWLAMISKPEPLYSEHGGYYRGGYWDTKEGRWKDGVIDRHYNNSDHYFRGDGYFDGGGLPHQTEKSSSEKVGFQGASAVGNAPTKTGLVVGGHQGSTVNGPSTIDSTSKLGGSVTSHTSDADLWPKDEFEPIGGAQSEEPSGVVEHEATISEGLGRTDGGGVGGTTEATGRAGVGGTDGVGTTETSQAQAASAVVSPGKTGSGGPATEVINDDLGKIINKDAGDATKLVEPITNTVGSYEDLDDDLDDLTLEDIIVLLLPCNTAAEVSSVLDEISSTRLAELKIALSKMFEDGHMEYQEYKEIMDDIESYEADLQIRLEMDGLEVGP